MAHGKGGRDGPEMAAAFRGGAEQEGVSPLGLTRAAWVPPLTPSSKPN